MNYRSFSIGKTRWRSIGTALAALLACTALSVPAQPSPPVLPSAPSVLPALGEAAGEGWSPAAERALGDRIMRDIWRDPSYLDDAVLLEHVTRVWDRLMAAAKKRGEITFELEARFAWQAFLVRDRTVNAFALPGGYVGINLGLIAVTLNRDEMASVLAHELSHVTQRHIVRSMGISQRQSIVGLAAMVLGAIALSRSPQAAQAIMATGQAVAVQGQLNFSRDMEREADRVGFGVLTAADFASSGMAGMFERMELAARLNDDGSFPYLRTHPLTAERIGEARVRAGLPSSGSGASRLEPMDAIHTLMRARARVLMDPRAVSWQRLIHEAAASNAGGSPREPTGESAADTLNRLASAYAGAFAAAQLHDPAQSMQSWAWMEQRARELPSSTRDTVWPELLRLRVEMALMRADSQAADQSLAALAGDSGRATEMLRARRALLPNTDVQLAQQAVGALQTRVASTPEDAEAWRLLAQLWQRLNQPLRAVRAEAETAAAHGDAAGAIDRLRVGQRLVREAGRIDFVEASVIDARLHALELVYRQQVAEEGNSR